MLSPTFYHGEGGLTMTNEELARRIQQGEILVEVTSQVKVVPSYIWDIITKKCLKD